MNTEQIIISYTATDDGIMLTMIKNGIDGEDCVKFINEQSELSDTIITELKKIVEIWQ